MTENELKCPECGARVPDTGMSSSCGTGDAGGEIHLQPPRQHATCKGCGSQLVRKPENAEHGLDEWRLLEGR